jgi:hypothetical protein
VRKTLVGALIGLLGGAVLTPLLLRVSVAVVRSVLEPPMRIEHGVIYLSVVLGASAGAVTGALVGLAGAVVAALRERHLSAPAGSVSGPQQPRAAPGG